MYDTVKTIYASNAEQLRDNHLPYRPLEFGTLNEKWGLYTDVATPEYAYPVISYIAAGRGGFRAIADTNGRLKTDVASHEPTDAALFEHIPFIARPINDDLTAVEREGYAGRVLVNTGGVEQFLYYLKRVAVTPSTPAIDIQTIVDDVPVVTPYQPTPGQLDPSIRALSNVELNVVSGSHISVQTPGVIPFNSVDVTEMVAACIALFGDASYANLSEVGMVSAIPTQVNSTLGGINITYTEAILAQIDLHIPTSVLLPIASSSGFDIEYSTGTVTPYTP